MPHNSFLAGKTATNVPPEGRIARLAATLPPHSAGLDANIAFRNAVLRLQIQSTRLEVLAGGLLLTDVALALKIRHLYNFSVAQEGLSMRNKTVFVCCIRDRGRTPERSTQGTVPQYAISF